MSQTRIDAEQCEEWARLGAAGDGEACRQLVEHLWPTWLELIRKNRSMGTLARSEDHVHNVAVTLLAKLGRPNGALRLYPPWVEQNAAKSFLDWMRILVANAVRSYVRAQLGSRTADDEPSPKRLLNELSASPLLAELGFRPPITAAQTARELIEFARSSLPEPQAHALSLWLEGEPDTAIDLALGQVPGDGKKLVRAAIAALRRRFELAK